MTVLQGVILVVYGVFCRETIIGYDRAEQSRAEQNRTEHLEIQKLKLEEEC
jgi:hypothetical protein